MYVSVVYDIRAAGGLFLLRNLLLVPEEKVLRGEL
jgi:hypothetical protein